MSAELQLEYTEEELDMLTTARKAADEFAKMDPAKVQEIYSACIHALIPKMEELAEWAVKETGYGNMSDKVVKNFAGSALHMKDNNAYKYATPKIDNLNKTVSFPKPAGVVLGLIPCTNPTSTVMMKCLNAIVTRNAVIMCGHPAAKECSNATATIIRDVAEAHGLPKGVIQWLDQPNVDQVGRLMKSDQIDVILATGGPSMVRAAYSSGNPALGVGPANVACYVDRTAKIKKTAKRITESVCFDNALPCTTESVVLADEPVADKLRKELAQNEARPAVWVKGAKLEKLREYVYPEGQFNPECLGKDADIIAKNAGFTVPKGTRTLMVEIDRIAYDEPFSKEKMWPGLGFLVVKDSDEGLEKAQEMLALGGKGHSAVVHSNNPKVVAKFGEALPVCRISVNVGGMSGSSGIETNLPTTGIIGTGFFGRSSVSHNITAGDLIQWTRCAYNIRPTVLMGAMNLAVDRPNRAARLKNKAAIVADLTKAMAKAVPIVKKHAPPISLV